MLRGSCINSICWTNKVKCTRTTRLDTEYMYIDMCCRSPISCLDYSISRQCVSSAFPRQRIGAYVCIDSSPATSMILLLLSQFKTKAKYEKINAWNVRESTAGVHSNRVRFHYWPTDKKLRVCAPKTMQTISIFSFFHSLFLIFFSPNEFNVNIHTPKHMQSIYQDFVGVLSSSTTRSPLLIVGFSGI